MFYLETERLILREMNLDDFDSLKEIISDKETMSYYKEPYDDNGVLRWINWNVENYNTYGFGLFAVILKENNKFIGDTGITIQNINGYYRPEIGYHFNKKYWRKGYAKEATNAIKKWAFKNTPFKKLYSYMNSENIASIKTAESNGMKFVNEYISKEGEPLKVYCIEKENISDE